MVLGLEDYIGNQYIRALAVLVIVFVVLRVLVFILEKVVLKLTSKTQTKADDELLSKASKPITNIVLLIGLRIALEELMLSEYIAMIFERAIISFIAVFVAYLVYLIVDIVIFRALHHVARGRHEAMRDLLNLIKNVLKVVLVIIAFLYILSLWGVEVGPFLAGLGIAGIAVALALQPTLANIFSGASILIDKSIKVGDVVYLDASTRGKVIQIGLRATRIQTFDNEVIVVPNSKVADNNIQNLALPDPKARVVIQFGVAYGSDIAQVKKIVMSEVVNVNHFIKDPEPIVRFLEMGASSLNFKAYFYVKSYENRFEAIDEANTRIYNALNKAGIEIPFPQLDVHLKGSQSSTSKKKK